MILKNKKHAMNPKKLIKQPIFKAQLKMKRKSHFNTQ